MLPARFPNLLVNGGSGIAVGMATNIPPHNLREVVSATIAYIDDPAIDVEGLMKYIKGPDFPTAGTILGREGIRDAYATGRGRVRVQAKAHIEPIGQGKEAIIVTELPFQVRKGGDGGLILKIRDLVRGEEDPRDLRSARRVRPPRDADRDRAQARRDPQGRAQQAVQAHADADDVRRQHGRAGRQRAPHAVAARGDRPLRRAPARDHHPPHQVRAAPRRGARARLGGHADRAGQPRRGDRADPQLARSRGRPHRADRALRADARPGPGDSAADPQPPDRPGGRQDQAGARRPASSGSRSCATSSAPRSASTC